MPEDIEITTAAGRRLTLQVGGDPSGIPVLFHHGTPNSRILAATSIDTATESGVRLMSYDRPGYGRSDRQQGRTVADAAADVRAIAAALGIERLGVIGLSGGGPHALACAALLEDLVPAVVSWAAVAPFDGEGLDYFEGMGELNVEDIKLMQSDPEAAWEKAEQDRAEILTSSREELLAAWDTILPDVDEAMFDEPFTEFTLSQFRDGFAPGAEGYWDDSVAFMMPWGFDVAAIRTPVRLRQGRHDLMVPYGHGVWLAGQIPGVEAILTDTDGHLTLFHYLADDLAWLKRYL